MTAFDRSRGNWTMTSNRLFDLTARGAVKPLETQILAVVNRLTVGVSKIGRLVAPSPNGFEFVALSLNRLATETGASRTAVRGAVKRLEALNILSVSRSAETHGRGGEHRNRYAINHDSQAWLISVDPIEPREADYSLEGEAYLPHRGDKGQVELPRGREAELPLPDQQSPVVISAEQPERPTKDRSKDSPLPPKGNEGDSLGNRKRDLGYKPSLSIEEVRARQWTLEEALEQAALTYLNKFSVPLRRSERQEAREALTSSPHIQSLLVLWVRAVDRAFAGRQAQARKTDGERWLKKNPYRDVMEEYSRQVSAARARQTPTPSPPLDEWAAVTQELRRQQSPEVA